MELGIWIALLLLVLAVSCLATVYMFYKRLKRRKVEIRMAHKEFQIPLSILKRRGPSTKMKNELMKAKLKRKNKTAILNDSVMSSE